MNNKIFKKALAERRDKSSSRRPRYALRKLSIGVVSCIIGYAFLIGGNVSFAETDTHPSDQIEEIFEKSEISEEKIADNTSNISDEKTEIKEIDITSYSSEEKSNSTENFEEKQEIPGHNAQFTIVFDANGGKFDTENNTLTVNSGDNAIFSEIPSFYGKIFVGWASSPDATEAQKDILQNISSNKTVYAVWKVDKTTTAKTEQKPIVTSEKPEDVSDYVSLNFNATSFTEDDGTLHYGKLLNEKNEEVETNNEIEGVKTRTYWVLKSATWKDIKDFTDKEGKNVYQNLTASSGDEKHQFLGWADSSSLDTVVNLANKFEDTSVIGENPNDRLNFYAKYKTNDVIYYGKTDTSNPTYDSDGYKINLNSDYNKVTFKLKDEKIGKVYLKEEQKDLLGKDVVANDDGSIELTDAKINDKEITVFVHKSKAQSTGFRDIKIETDSIDKNYQYWYWYRGELDGVKREDDWELVFPPSLNGIKNPEEVCFVPLFVTNGQDVTEFKSKPAPPKMPLVGKNSTRTRFELVTLKKEEQIDDILRKDGKSYFDRTYVVFREYKADFIFEKHPPENSGPVLPKLKEEFKNNYTNPHWYDNQKRKYSYYDNVDLSNEIIYKSKIYTAKATRIPVIHEINEASEIIQGTAETGGVVNLYVDGKYSGEAVVDSKGRWKFNQTDRFSLKEGSEIEIKYSSYKRTLPASAKIIVKKAADNIKFNPIYTGSVANPGEKATVSAPKFINELNKSELVDNSVVKKFELIEKTIEGVSIDKKTGEITYNTKESDADKTIDLNVKVTYLDDTTENVNTTIKINPLSDIINREENPSAQIPDGYVRVRIIAGEGVRLKEIEKIYDIKKGLSLSETLYPEVEINPENINDYKEPISWTISPGEAIENSVEIVANATKTQAFANNPAGKEIKIFEGETIEAEKLIDNLQNLPANTTFEFKEKPDTTTAGTIDATIIVKYSDGSVYEVKSTIIVQKQAAIITPIPEVEAIDEIVEFGKIYDLTDNIKNLPEKATVEDITEKGAIDTKTSGNYIGKVKVTFENGEARIVRVKVVVNKSLAEVNEPAGKEIKIFEGETIEAEKLIDNLQNLPANTTFEFKEKPDTTTAGTIDATIIVKYSDGSVYEVKSTIIVQKQAAIITPIPEVEAIDEIVEFGKIYDLTDNIKNLPEKATVEDITEKGAIDTKTSGNYIGKVKVTFENGEARIVRVKVVVNKSLAEKFVPEVKVIEVESEELSTEVLGSAIVNFPRDSKIEIKSKSEGKVLVTIKFSDGSERDIEISYKIKEIKTDVENPETNDDEGKNTEKNIDTIKPTEEKFEKKPQTSHQTSKTSEKSSKRPEKLMPDKKFESNSKTTKDKKLVEIKDGLDNGDISHNKEKVKKSNPKSQLPKAGTSVEITNLTLASLFYTIGAYFTKKKR
ncbi:YSIRK-type signal peptide-containing protein [Finegoldia sp. BIOML-A2]|uniref:Rib/alpha-like domain-containing protein n=1 Tax=unclassified Finegoldia TaxID=2619637 RepID=UPI0012AFA3A0|nr:MULTISPECIES: Rib/alpha-like domain-containing protein [unclassified Finegoldia]MSA96727.1 YSIRK-type signal peptide-containing protein [Finegoldia sp. BIOML-A5]MSB00112.1 YSIRK-type signal peptide-containing protein [Finegoldia sp. BIOML-A2]